jgi:hypothetical protein
MVRVSILAFLALIAGCGIAAAQSEPSEAAKGMVGNWEISNVDRDRRCPLTFAVDPAPGGLKVELDPACLTAFPSLGDVVAWDFGSNNMLRLLDAKKTPVMEFTEVESGMFESERGADGLLFLQTQAAVRVETRSAEQLFGDWNLLRDADKVLCRLTLSKDTNAPDVYRIVVKPGCDKTIMNFGLSTWRLDRDQLVLSGRTSAWRFAESDSTIWERVPLTTDPLLLVRQ